MHIGNEVLSRMGPLLDMAPKIESIIKTGADARLHVAIGFKRNAAHGGRFEPYIDDSTRLYGRITGGISSLEVSPMGGPMRLRVSSGSINAQLAFEIKLLGGLSWDPRSIAGFSALSLQPSFSGSVTSTLPMTCSLLPGSLTINSLTNIGFSNGATSVSTSITCSNCQVWSQLLSINIMDILSKDPQVLIDQLDYTFQSMHESLVASQGMKVDNRLI
jgi:hypothetical protein